MIIFARANDLLAWLLARSEGFPKAQRFVVTARLQNAVLDLCELLHEANARAIPRERLSCLEQADACLGKLRMYTRLAQGWGWLTAGQYAHVGKMIAEVGRLLGGWMRQTSGRA